MQQISGLTAADLTPDLLAELAEVLVDAVDDGASVGFVHPFGARDAADWWTRALGPVDDGTTLMWVARDDEGRVTGTVQAALEQMPNGRHRAEVKKLLVHRRSRGRGLGRALLAAAERGAEQAGATLLILDTETGSPAETLYRSSGWVEVGTIPFHAAKPDGELKATTYFYKYLGETD
ncbi:GNAT superfamily N-acetyltransferase [Allocatelliglobosispora scoriae]|uniref:GNAT superfamily N-acetyltransferase n=1 Tax=Allocatelliglobosispora scoriae TaxID=643052 RepID=A0A841BJT7_9ACTN|nr:GNAT family N-acetyltransferase [Allocatelliglobosispora scoriae]MBB5867161.1 GNAT superfamily N-acetyltransferase [Allocatelliglobosispora scoriae]